MCDMLSQKPAVTHAQCKGTISVILKGGIKQCLVDDSSNQLSLLAKRSIKTNSQLHRRYNCEHKERSQTITEAMIHPHVLLEKDFLFTVLQHTETAV